MKSIIGLVDVNDRKAALSSLWVFVMFCIAYADLIGLIEPGMLQKIINGELGITITPGMVLLLSIIQAIPICMILVSRWVRRAVNRRANIAAVALTLVYVLGGGNWESTSYFVFATLEVLALLGIFWAAWTWRSIDDDSIQSSQE